MGKVLTPQWLPENVGMAYAGVRVPSGLIVGAAAAQRMLAARNRHGKSNADVLRPYCDADDFALQGRDLPRWGVSSLTRHSVRWVVDFPADTTPEEASLYAEPWRRFAKAGGVLHSRADPMRIAIARIDSFLAAPLGRTLRGFARLDSATLPGAGLCVVATDDDFVAAVLQSGVFGSWVRAHGGRLRVHHVASFPFPWPPRTERGALTRAQLELRDNVLRANAADLDTAVAATYGWRDIDDEVDLVTSLRGIHSARD